MLRYLASIAKEFIGITGIIGTIACLFFIPRPKFKEKESEVSKKIPNHIFASIITFFIVFKVTILVFVISLGLFLFFQSTGLGVTTPPPTASPTPAPPATPTTEPPSLIISPTTYCLDDLQVLNKKPDEAFVFHQWEDNFPIKIDNQEYLHSIGVRLPVEIKDDLKDNHPTDRSDYSAEIEYSLGYKYDTFQFSYGIDDNTFKDYGLPPPNCHYWIVVESCSCREDSKVKSIELCKTPEVNYMQTIGKSVIIDVSNVETLRLTFFFVFDVLPTKPLTLNVAIVNPILNS